jgi:hypothetical protein
MSTAAASHDDEDEVHSLAELGHDLLAEGKVSVG